MDVLSIKGLIGKLQVHEEIVKKFKKIWVHKNFFQSKKVLNISMGLEDVDKVEEEADLKEVMTTLIGQPVDRMKQTG
jgi:hypothetical protein